MTKHHCPDIKTAIARDHIRCMKCIKAVTIPSVDLQDAFYTTIEQDKQEMLKALITRFGCYIDDEKRCPCVIASILKKDGCFRIARDMGCRSCIEIDTTEFYKKNHVDRNNFNEKTTYLPSWCHKLDPKHIKEITNCKIPIYPSHKY